MAKRGLIHKSKSRAAVREKSPAAEVGQESDAAARPRMKLPLFGDPRGLRVNLNASDLAQALADEDALRARRRRRLS